MDKFRFRQGMNHAVAMRNDVSDKLFKNDRAKNRFAKNFASLPISG